MAEVRVEQRVRNNVLWHAIHDRYHSVAELCRAHPKLSPTSVGELLNLKPTSLWRPNGEYRKLAMNLAMIFGMTPETLFPERLYRLTRTKAVVEIPLTALPPSDHRLLIESRISPDTTGDATVNAELRQALRTAVEVLRPREQTVLQKRYEKDLTYDEIAAEMCLTKERIRQIELKALCKLRRPSIIKKLGPFIDS